MATLATGLKQNRVTNIAIDNQSTIELPKNAEETIQQIVKFLPSEHLAGIDKIKLVDFIKPPQMKNMDVAIKGDLPGLYHPKVMNNKPYLEVSVGALLQPTEGFAKRWMAKTSFKGNIAGLIFGLVGQHYYLTLRHSVKKTNMEPQIRQYMEKNLKAWSEKQNENSFRAKLFKPLRPTFERLAKWLNKKTVQAQKKS
ncbi:MAG: hypothetical protein MUC29_01120 [Pyrinomonadaceae bacterium]|jgi:hypothetical protein|nr:hypothetical protein [Pyrinomonadaceae bacterium]